MYNGLFTYIQMTAASIVTRTQWATSVTRGTTLTSWARNISVSVVRYLEMEHIDTQYNTSAAELN